MTNFNDKQLLNAILNDHKLSASALTNLVMESTNQNLRNDATKILNNCFTEQKQVFDIMSKKGWYNVSPANKADVTRVHQEIMSAQG